MNGVDKQEDRKLTASFLFQEYEWDLMNRGEIPVSLIWNMLRVMVSMEKQKNNTRKQIEELEMRIGDITERVNELNYRLLDLLEMMRQR